MKITGVIKLNHSVIICCILEVILNIYLIHFVILQKHNWKCFLKKQHTTKRFDNYWQGNLFPAFRNNVCLHSMEKWVQAKPHFIQAIMQVFRFERQHYQPYICIN